MNSCKLYIGNLPYEATSKELISLFAPFGDIIEAMTIPNNAMPGMSKGFGFVTFAKPEDCTRAMDLHGKEFKGRQLTVQPAKEEDVNAAK